MKAKRIHSIILIAAILAAAVVMLAGYAYSVSRMSRPMLRITVDDKAFGTYSLDEDRIIDINGTNRCEIRDGKARMVWADCPDQICVRSVPVDSSGGTIVCMPNKVVLTITDAEQDEEKPDTVTG